MEDNNKTWKVTIKNRKLTDSYTYIWQADFGELPDKVNEQCDKIIDHIESRDIFDTKLPAQYRKELKEAFTWKIEKYLLPSYKNIVLGKKYYTEKEARDDFEKVCCDFNSLSSKIIQSGEWNAEDFYETVIGTALSMFIKTIDADDE